ncbi:MAG: guanylate kinase [Lachnospiraceae bacterium]|jgi:guanylate kinase
MGKIFYIMGKSASGKDSIYEKLKSQKSFRLEPLVLYTTRPIREGEKEGREYFFVKEEKRQELIKAGKVIESRSYDTVYGIWSYFTADEGQIELEKNDYLGIGTLESYEKLKDYYGENVVCPIYIEVEDGERLKRAIAREEAQQTPKYEEMCRRFLADAQDFSEANIEKAGITRRFVNGDFAHCLQQIEEYIGGMR